MRRSGLGRVVVRGRSMEPTLRDGDHLLVRWGGTPRPGRLVVVRWPDRPLSVKRAGLLAEDGWWVERDNPLEGVDSWQAGPVCWTVISRVSPSQSIARCSTR